MADDFSNWDDEENGGGEGGEEYNQDGAGEDGVYYDDDGNAYDENGQPIYDDGVGAEDGAVYDDEEGGGEVEGEGDETYQDEADGGGEEYVDDASVEYTDDGADDQTYDNDGEGEGGDDGYFDQEAAADEPEGEPEPESQPVPFVKPSALEEARKKALQGRFMSGAGASSTAGSSAFTTQPAASATSAFGSSAFGAPTPSAFGIGGRSSAFASNTSSIFASPPATVPSSTSTTTTPAKSAFGNAAFTTPTAAAGNNTTSGKKDKKSTPKIAAFTTPTSAFNQSTEDASSTRSNKRDKKDKKKDKKESATSGATSNSSGMDSSQSALNNRSKRFSNMLPPPSSASLEPPPFRGGTAKNSFLSSSPSPSPSPSPPIASQTRSTANMMAIAMGGVASDSGMDDGETYTAANFRAIVGQCQLMCPLEEQAARQESRDLSYFEIIPGTGSKEHGDVPLVDKNKAVKKYKRAAAAQTLNPKDVRPPDVLKRTMDYLIHSIMDRTDSPDPPPLPSFLVIYRFVSDRMRAMRQDFHCQAQKDPLAIRCYEIMARFHIITMYELGDVNNVEKFDPTPNVEKLSQTLTSLRHMYFDNYSNVSHAPFPTPNEAEMHSYRLLIDLDRKFGTLYEELDKFDPTVKASPIVQLCVGVHAAFRENNYSKFFALVRRMPYCHAVLLQTYFTKVRVRALEVMSHAYKQYPFDEFETQLAFEDRQHALTFLHHYGIEHDGSGVIQFNKHTFVMPESNFPFRNSHRIIAAKRPPTVSKAVLAEVGRGDQLGLEDVIGKRLTSIAKATTLQRPAVARPKSISSTTTSTSLPTPSPFPSSFTASSSPIPSAAKSGFGTNTPAVTGFSSLLSSSGRGPTSGTPASSASASTSPMPPAFGVPSTAALESLTSKPTKIQRPSTSSNAIVAAAPASTSNAFSSAPTGNTFGSMTSATTTTTTPSAFSSKPSSTLNAKAAPFVPAFSSTPAAAPSSTATTKPSTTTGLTFGTTPVSTTAPSTSTSAAVKPVTSSSAFAAANTRGALFGAQAPSAPSSAPAFPSAASSAFGSSTSSFSSSILPSQPSSSQTLPPPSFEGFGKLSATTAAALTSTDKATPPVVHLAGFQLPNAIAGVTPTSTPSPAFGTNSFATTTASSAISSTSFAPISATAASAVTPHTRPPMARVPSSSQQQLDGTRSSTSPAVPRRPQSPTPLEQHDMFLTALHHYKRTLIRSHFGGWFVEWQKRYRAQQVLEQHARMFQLTKHFLNWHQRYVEGVEIRQRFRQAQVALHAPLTVALSSPIKPMPHRTPKSTKKGPSHRADEFVTTTTPAFAPHFLPTSIPSAGLTTPFARLAAMGLVEPQQEPLEDYEDEEEDVGEGEDDGDGVYDHQEDENGAHEQYDEGDEEYVDDEMMVDENAEEGGDASSNGVFHPADANLSFRATPSHSFIHSSTFHSPALAAGSSFQSPLRSTVSNSASRHAASILPSPNKSGHKRTREDGSILSPQRPTQSSSFPYSPAEEKNDQLNVTTQRAKLFHTPSKLTARTVFSTPNASQSSNDLLRQLEEELEETSKLTELLDQLEQQFPAY